MTTAKIIFLAALATALPSVAQANSGRASAQIANLVFHAIDINPADGIDAGYVFLDQGSSTGLDFVDQQPPLILPGLLTDAVKSDDTHSASVSLSGMKVSVRGEGLDFNNRVEAYSGVQDPSSSVTYNDVSIRLAPNSVLQISADLLVSAERACLPRENGYCYAGASAEMILFSHRDETQPVGFSSTFKLNQYTLWEDNFSVEKPGYVSYVNFGDQYKDLGLTLKVSSYVSSYATSPTPEPSSYVLMMAGLAMVGFLGRPRSSQNKK